MGVNVAAHTRHVFLGSAHPGAYPMSIRIFPYLSVEADYYS